VDKAEIAASARGFERALHAPTSGISWPTAGYNDGMATKSRVAPKWTPKYRRSHVGDIL
jgi:hypothetical protein